MNSYYLTHWGRATHVCVGKLTIIGSDNGLSPGRRQAIIWTNAGILLIRPWGTNFSENFIRNQIFSFKKMHLKMSSAKWRPVYLGLNVLLIYISKMCPMCVSAQIWMLWFQGKDWCRWWSVVRSIYFYLLQIVCVTLNNNVRLVCIYHPLSNHYGHRTSVSLPNDVT